ncbi:glycosyltransferase family 2 protein [Streptomyces orinoci]|uniref:Glycosyltransferase family 2 protein n=1 Tax=Streptomyces orinoci TaxID=67339 RepID=A0ABV3K6I0_STRON|nr:glycosyltransferase family 2 protein [Streptomyces orinoci]
MNESETPVHPASPGTPLTGAVSIIVIGYNDAAHIADAVRSALAQGPVAGEVIAVDDASTDGTGAVLDQLAAAEPRLRVIHRTANSGGCGTPRNQGLRTAGSPYVMFLDSDDLLPAHAAETLLGAALRHNAPVAAGLCVRRELPRGRDTGWQPALYREAALLRSPEDRPALLHDTLCVNKLYARDFLAEHGITFPEGPFRYEDFVFTARLLAAAPPIATVPEQVYIWHVRRDAARPSLSLDRESVGNWRARVHAHTQAVRILQDAGRDQLARAARVKFLDHDLRLYTRELPLRGPAYRRAWWRTTRDLLAAYTPGELAASRAPAHWIARVVLAAEHPRDLDRLAQLATRPARLLPPYARSDGHPVWADDLPSVRLDGLTAKPVRRLPVTVDGSLRLTSWPPRAELTLTVHELYDRLSAAEPTSITVELRLRGTDTVRSCSAPLTPSGPGWTARLSFALETVAGEPLPLVWDFRVRLRCRGGSLWTAVRAIGGSPRRILPSLRSGLLLAQPYPTAGGSLALRVAPGPRGAWAVLRGRLRRRAP